jgi:transcription antitermination factor NusG
MNGNDMSECCEARWHALYVRSRHEKSVGAQLEAKAQNVFLPLYSSKHRWADRCKAVQLPLFPGYIFCHFNNNNRSSVLATSGVIDVVRIGSQPAAIDPGVIEAIRRAVNSPLQIEPHTDLVVGERVMMSEGPLKGLTGTLTEVRMRLRLVISVDLLCRSVLVEIDRAWVVPAQSSMRACSEFFPGTAARVA